MEYFEKMNIIGDFERIIILKTIIFDVNLNFLCLNDLEKISETAYNLEIELPINTVDEEGDEINSLESLYDSQYEIIKKIYKEWCNIVYEMFLQKKEELEKIINSKN